MILVYSQTETIFFMRSYISILCILLFTSCLNDFDVPESLDQTEADIISYLTDNNISAQRSNSGLYYIIDEEGTGTRPATDSNVTVAYKGQFLDGTVFEESSANGITFNLSQVIPGWTEGITYFKEGGKGKLIVPSYLAYGSNGTSRIPGGAILIFDIHLISVN